MKAIIINFCMANACLSSDPINLTVEHIVLFSQNNWANVISTHKDFAKRFFCMKLTHPEFETVQLGHEIPEFDQEEARKRYPFLFVNTNPLLWRKF